MSSLFSIESRNLLKPKLAILIQEDLMVLKYDKYLASDVSEFVHMMKSLKSNAVSITIEAWTPDTKDRLRELFEYQPFADLLEDVFVKFTRAIVDAADKDKEQPKSWVANQFFEELGKLPHLRSIGMTTKSMSAPPASDIEGLEGLGRLMALLSKIDSRHPSEYVDVTKLPRVPHVYCTWNMTVAEFEELAQRSLTIHTGVYCPKQTALNLGTLKDCLIFVRALDARKMTPEELYAPIHLKLTSDVLKNVALVAGSDVVSVVYDLTDITSELDSFANAESLYLGTPPPKVKKLVLVAKSGKFEALMVNNLGPELEHAHLRVQRKVYQPNVLEWAVDKVKHVPNYYVEVKGQGTKTKGTYRLTNKPKTH
jgi:hypothetical protein